MKRVSILLALSVAIIMLGGCGSKSTPRAEGSQFNGDIRDKGSSFK
jgi:hypothetical protein